MRSSLSAERGAQDVDNVMLSELVGLCQHPDLEGIAVREVRALRVTSSG